MLCGCHNSKGHHLFYFPSAALGGPVRNVAFPGAPSCLRATSLRRGEAIPLTEPLVSPRITMGSLSLHPSPRQSRWEPANP